MLKTEKVFECPRCHSTLNILVETTNNAKISKFIINEDITSHFEAIMRSTYQSFLYHQDVPEAQVKKEVERALRLYLKLQKELQALIYRTIEHWGRDDFVNFDGIYDLMWEACK